MVKIGVQLRKLLQNEIKNQDVRFFGTPGTLRLSPVG